MIKKCSGCGYKLQSKDNKELGYIPKDKLNNSSLCERCFKIIHYNDAKVVTLGLDQKEILKIVNDSKNHVLFLIDFLNLNEETLNVFKKIKNDKTLIISKCDIIPNSIKKDKIITWLNDYYKINEKVFFISSLKNKNIREVVNYLKRSSIKKAYLLGYTNAGKSSLLNAIFNNYDLNNNLITTSLIPNTTLDFMNIKIDEDLTIIDSPGFTVSTLYNLDDIKFIKKINPKKFLKPITYQMKKDTSILIEDKIAITNVDEKNSMTFYISNLIKLDKVFNDTKFKHLKSKTYEIDNNSDLVIKGLGFINIKKAGKIKVYIDDFSLIEIRKSMF